MNILRRVSLYTCAKPASGQATHLEVALISNRMYTFKIFIDIDTLLFKVEVQLHNTTHSL